MTDRGRQPSTRESIMGERRRRHPGLRDAIVADARLTAAHRGERYEFRSGPDTAIQVVRLAWQSDAFFAQALYRVKARLQSVGVPILPRIAHRLAIAWGQLAIGDPVVVKPGVYILHGQVVIDGLCEIGSGVTIAPFVTIGLRKGDIVGPTIGEGVQIGTGAKILGRITVGDGASIGANAVVLDDVPAGVTVTGVPARASDPQTP